MAEATLFKNRRAKPATIDEMNEAISRMGAESEDGV